MFCMWSNLDDVWSNVRWYEVRHLGGVTMVDDNTSQDGFNNQKKNNLDNLYSNMFSKINTSILPIPVKSKHAKLTFKPEW